MLPGPYATFLIFSISAVGGPAFPMIYPNCNSPAISAEEHETVWKADSTAGVCDQRSEMTPEPPNQIYWDLKQLVWYAMMGGRFCWRSETSIQTVDRLIMVDQLDLEYQSVIKGKGRWRTRLQSFCLDTFVVLKGVQEEKLYLRFAWRLRAGHISKFRLVFASPRRFLFLCPNLW